MLGRILGGLALCAIGGACCYYSYSLVEIFGRNAWMERNLGGTRMGVVLLGFLLIILGVLMMFGVFTISDPVGQVSSRRL